MKLQKYDGYSLPSDFKKIHNEILEMEVHDSDVWLCSFPKSGTTWSQELVWLLCNEINFDRANSEYLTKRFPFLETTMYGQEIWKITKTQFLNEDSCVDYLKKLENKRFIKTHLPWNLLPKQIQNFERKPKIIYVKRNPKDVVVSAFHHFTAMGDDSDFRNFFKDFLGGDFLYGPYWDNVKSYTDKKLINLCVIQFEEMKKNLEKQVRKLSKFLETKIDDTEIIKLLEHLNIENMRKNKMLNDEEFMKAFQQNKESTDFFFIRSGKVGGYRELISPEMEIEIDAWIKENAL